MLRSDGDFAEPQPRLVAHIAIVVCREGDDDVCASAVNHLEAHAISGGSLNDLNVKVGRYVTDAFTSLPFPAEGHVSVARPRKSPST